MPTVDKLSNKGKKSVTTQNMDESQMDYAKEKKWDPKV